MNPDLEPGALQKPERLAVAKRRARSERRRTRAQVREIVYRRERMRCERCHKKVKRWNEAYPTDPDMGHVNERVPRSAGGDPLDPDNCELACGACHMPNNEHAPTPARQARLTEIRSEAKRRRAAARD